MQTQLSKRVFDLLTASVLLVLTSPLMAVIAIAVKATSAGPVFFVQTRVGRKEREFQCLKFRTMLVGSPNVATHDATSSWLTPVGRFLRQSKLDELPQLINILRGEMSLVGPRPCLPQQLELIQERRKLAVFDVLPGLTGHAQLAGIDMSAPLNLAVADADYIARRSFLGDLSILASTAMGRGARDGV